MELRLANCDCLAVPCVCGHPIERNRSAYGYRWSSGAASHSDYAIWGPLNGGDSGWEGCRLGRRHQGSDCDGAHAARERSNRLPHICNALSITQCVSGRGTSGNVRQAGDYGDGDGDTCNLNPRGCKRTQILTQLKLKAHMYVSPWQRLCRYHKATSRAGQGPGRSILDGWMDEHSTSHVWECRLPTTSLFGHEEHQTTCAFSRRHDLSTALHRSPFEGRRSVSPMLIGEL